MNAKKAKKIRQAARAFKMTPAQLRKLEREAKTSTPERQSDIIKFCEKKLAEKRQKETTLVLPPRLAGQPLIVSPQTALRQMEANERQARDAVGSRAPLIIAGK